MGHPVGVGVAGHALSLLFCTACSKHACSIAAMASITSALMALNGEDEASVRRITDALNANGFSCDVDVASGAFLGLSEGDLAALRLDIKQKATVRATQDAVKRMHGG